MSGLDPQGPSQPSMQTGYNQAQNPASQTTTEHSTSQETNSSKTIDQRSSHDVPATHQTEATSTSLGYGETGPLTEKKLPESDALHYSKDGNLEGEQMRAPGEGEVAEAVRTGGGGGHAPEGSLTADMDRKTDEHEAALHDQGKKTGKELEEEEKEDWTGKKADVGEALSGRDTKVVLAAEE